MQNINYSLGINKKGTRFVHKFLAAVMLYNSLFGYSQTMLYNYFTSGYFKSHFVSGGDGHTPQHSSLPETNGPAKKDTLAKVAPAITTIVAPVRHQISTTLNKSYSANADIAHGYIGVSAEKPLDYPGDNIFKIGIKDIPDSSSFKAFLHYEVYGIDAGAAIPVSVNQGFSSGGYLIKNNSAWTSRKEEIDTRLLKNGVNSIMFSVPQGANYNYEVRNVKLVIEPVAAGSVVAPLVMGTPSVSLSKGNEVYIKGFIRNYKDRLAVYAEETLLHTNGGTFEGFITLTDAIKNKGFIVVKAADSHGFLGQEIVYVDRMSLADQVYPIEMYPLKKETTFKKGAAGYLEVSGASLSVTDSTALNESKISLSALRFVDIAPLNSGMTNVSPEGKAWRVEAGDGIFKTPAKLEFEYDESRLPHGYSANDIKVFYFDISSKSWRMIPRESLNKENKSIVVKIKYAADYISGVMQSPESPQADGFTPTKPDGLKAADPAAEMTIISPPDVNQRGTAAISYPIKIPEGRKNMQPDIDLDYNSEGQNGWLGQGWDINIPSLTLDTRWGAPLFDGQNESEMYMLNGEQLMYPNLEGANWMPNRHYDIDGSGTTVYSTQARPRISAAVFTHRKEGTFDKIERLGTDPTNYHWKVTATNGTVYWYGGRENVVDNAVIKSGQNIVHWGLYMVEDTHTNNIIYEYENYTLPAQTGANANLSGAKVFNILNIYYTGWDGKPGLYVVHFKTDTSAIRNDVSINGKLGIKLADPYFLDYVKVSKVGDDNVWIRKYKFNIGYGKFHKGQMQSVAELDRADQEFYRHIFDYYDDLGVKPGEDAYFTASVTETICNDVPVPACPDSDGDGVCDSQDQCPTVAGPSSNYGCPLVCRETTFEVPSTYVYQYMLGYSMGGFGNSANVNSTNCFVNSVRLNKFTFEGLDYNAVPYNIFAIHGSGTNPWASRCPAYPLTYTPDHIVANPDSHTRIYDFLLNHFSIDNNFPIFNPQAGTDAYIKLQDIALPGGTITKAVSYAIIAPVFYSPLNKTLTINLDWNSPETSPTAYNLSTGNVPPVFVTPVPVYYSAGIYINGLAASIGSFDLSTTSGISLMQAALNGLYPGTTVSSTIPAGTNIPLITINTTNLGLQSVTVVPIGIIGSVTATYTFTPCSAGRGEMAIVHNDLRNLKADDKTINQGIKKWVASGEELRLPIELHCFQYIDEDMGPITKGVYQINESETSHIWKSNNIEIKDAIIIAALDQLYGIKEGKSSPPFIEYKNNELERRTKGQADAVLWLKNNIVGSEGIRPAVPSQEPQKVAAEQRIINTTPATMDTATVYTNYFNSLLNNFTINFNPIAFGNPDCPSFLNASFVIPGSIPSFNSAAAILGSTASTNFNLGGHLGVGVDFGWDYTSKNITIGGAYNHSWDDSESLTALVDINGDGLDDVVFKHFGSLYYKKHTLTRTYDANNNPVVTHSFAASAPIQSQNNDINDFYKSFGESQSTNIQVNFGFSGGGAFAGYEWSHNSSVSNTYFTDANADGLIDIVRRGVVYFNRINAAGNPYFEPQSLNTENMLIVAAPVTVTPPPLDIDTQSPHHDVVKVWEAPADGKIKIEGTVVNTDPSKDAIVTIETGVQEAEDVCGESIQPSGSEGSYTYTVYVGTATGITCINYNAYDVPDKFDITWDTTTVTTGYVGLSDYNSALVSAGVNSADIHTGSPSTGAGQLCFNKTTAEPTTIQITVSGVLSGTGWIFSTVCPDQALPRTVNAASTETKKSYSLSVPITEVRSGGTSVYINNNPLSRQHTTYNFADQNELARLKSDFEQVYPGSQVEVTDAAVLITVRESLLHLKSFSATLQNGTLKSYNFTETGATATTTPAFTTAQRYSPATCSFQPGALCLLYSKKLDASHPSDSVIIDTANTDCNPNGGDLRVKKGDRIYFRVHSTPTGNPAVNWNPQVYYVGSAAAATIDQNNLPVYSSSYSDGFILSNRAPVVFPGTGAARFEWSPITVSNPTDDVTFEIVKRVPNGTSYTETTFFTQTCAANVPSTVSQPAANTDSVTTVGTLYLFRVKATSNVNWKAIEWKPKMITTVSQPVVPVLNGASEGDVVVSDTKYPIPDYSIYTPYLCGGSYKTINVNNVLSNGDVAVGAQILLVSSLFQSTDNGTVYIVAKRGNAYVGETSITVTNGVPSTAGPISFGTGTDPNVELSFYADDSNRSVGNPQDVSLISRLINAPSFGLLFGTQTNSAVPFTPDYANFYTKTVSLYGPMYRQWGQFMYNAAAVTGATPIAGLGVNLLKEEALTITAAQATAIQGALLDGSNNPNTALTSLQNININDPGAPALMQSALQNISNNAGVGTYPLITASPYRDFESGNYTDKWIGLHPENYSNVTGARAAVLSQAYSFDYPASVTQGALNTGAYGIDKHSKGDGQSVSAGGGFAGVGASGTASLGGTSNALTDYIDLNGDSYPDIVTTGEVQYTLKTGGLNAPLSRGSFSGDMSDDSNGSWGFTASGTFSKSGKSTPGSDGLAPKADGSLRIGKPGISSFGLGNNATSLSGSFGQGTTDTSRMWADINGDGLPDIIIKNGSNITAYLNFGDTNFNSNNLWGSFNIGKGKSTTFGAGIGFNYANASIEAGLSLGRTDADTEYTLIDINNDGLLDNVSSGSSNISIDFNRGNKFGNTPVDYNAFNLYNSATTTTAGLNGTFTYSMIWPLYLIFIVIPLKIPDVSVTVAGGTSTNRVKKTITDFDGDGFPDLVEEVSSTSVKVSYSRIRRTDLLKTVHNPLGGNYTVDYEVQPVNYTNPTAKWAMKSVVVEDGYDKVNDGEDIYKKEFTYENGRYDRREREFYGYETVKTKEYKDDGNGQPVIYRTEVAIYHNHSYFLNGLLKEEYVIKGDDDSAKFSRTINEYQLKALNSTNTELDPASSLADTFDVGGKEGRRTAAVVLASTTTEFYELNSSPQITATTEMVYDGKARATEIHYNGDVANANDDYVTTIDYNNLPNNLISVPSDVKIMVGGTEKRRRTTEVNSYGNIEAINMYYDASSFSTVHIKYDQYGNETYVESPPNEGGESAWYAYTYDDVYYKYVVNIKDAYGHVSTGKYDSNLDKVLQTTDLSGSDMIYHYDSFGRNTFVLAPKEMAAHKRYTARFAYYPKFTDLPSGTAVTAENFVPVALAQHYDVQHDGDDIEIVAFADGLGRTIQVKKDITLNEDPTHQETAYFDAMSISGKTAYDTFGREVAHYHPYYEVKNTTTKLLLNEYASPIHPVTVYFDEIDREIRVTDPTGTTSETGYSIDQDADGTIAMKKRFVTDQNGSASNVTEQYTNVNGNMISVMNEGPGGAIWTRYSYNEIEELTSFTDDEGLSTSYNYDKLGRKILTKNPDNGVTSLKYDLANNIIELYTSNMEATGGYIKYKYHIKELIGVIFPQNPDGSDNVSNVEYAYGTSGNDFGRLVYQKDASGTQEFEYGNMGEVVETRRTVVAPTPSMPNRNFNTRYSYDSWNRLQQMVYPDGERVDYSYDTGGNLNQITGLLNGSPYSYIQRLDYDYYEKQLYVKYANNTENFYTYDDDLLRLQNLTVKTSDGHDLLNNKYDYDKVGNILGIENSAGISANTMGGNYRQRFEYDNLNRLQSAGGDFSGSEVQHEFNNDFSSSFRLSLKYNTTHGIIGKSQRHDKNNSPVAANTYDNSYKYHDGTHQVESITDGMTGTMQTFKYDHNGNMEYKDDGQGNSRHMLWDESNRLRVVDDNTNSLQHYIYDASGYRILKANSDVQATYQNGTIIDPSVVTINNYKMYPSAFLVIDEHGVYSKHYYAGHQRIVSRIGDQAPDFFDAQDYQPKGATVNYGQIKEQQQKDLINLLLKTKYRKVVYNEYKAYKYSDIEKIIDDENVQQRAMAANTTMAPPEEADLGAIYFYHPDHIGTSTFITDIDGNAYQFFINLPFGETMAEQLPSSYYRSPYKFNGKELDEETGLYYYGARYYDPSISIWLSTDPSLEYYPGVNPYVYCLQNPVKFTDPDGEDPIIGTITGALVGGLLEYLSIIFDKMIDDGMTFKNANASLRWCDVGDILIASALGAAEGIIDEGIGKVVEWLGNPKYLKMVKMATEIIISVGQDLVKRLYHDNPKELAIAETIMSTIISTITMDKIKFLDPDKLKEVGKEGLARAERASAEAATERMKPHVRWANVQNALKREKAERTNAQINYSISNGQRFVKDKIGGKLKDNLKESLIQGRKRNDKKPTTKKPNDSCHE